MPWGLKTLGKNDCLVQITKVLVPSHIPSRRYMDKLSPEKEWPESATTLGHLWDSEEVPVLELEWPL